MILALAAIVLIIALIMIDKLPFGAPSLLILLLVVMFGVTDIKTALDGFSSSTIMMLASFMVIITALQKISLLPRFKKTMFNLAAHGGSKVYVLLTLIVMLGCSFFEAGSTVYYVLIIGLLSNLPDPKALPPSRVLMPAGFAANCPLLPFNTVLQCGVAVAVLQSVGISTNVDLVKFSLVNPCLSLSSFVWCALTYRITPDHPITDQRTDKSGLEKKTTLSKQKEIIIYVSFVTAVVGMALQSKIGDAGYAITALAVGMLPIAGATSFDEIRSAISVLTILMPAGIIDVAGAPDNTSLTNLVGQTVANMLGNNVNPLILIFAFYILTNVPVTLTGSTIGTVYVFASIAIATCVNLGLDSAATAVAIIVSGWCRHLLPIDGVPTMIMGAGKYRISEFWKFTVPQCFTHLFVLTAGAVIFFPTK